MPSNENTSLLRNKQKVNGYKNHIVQIVPRDISEYEPILSNFDYSSSLTLAELLPYQDSKFWQSLRSIFFYIFWITFFFILCLACMLAYVHRKCDHESMFNTTNNNIMISTTASTITSKLTTLAALSTSSE